MLILLILGKQQIINTLEKMKLLSHPVPSSSLRDLQKVREKTIFGKSHYAGKRVKPRRYPIQL